MLDLEIVSQMKNNRSLGFDGITIEVIKVADPYLWEPLKNDEIK